MAKRSTKPAAEKPRAFLLGTMTMTLISETLAEVERLESAKNGGQPQADMIEMAFAKEHELEKPHGTAGRQHEDAGAHTCLETPECTPQRSR